jgi:ubiquinone/menaquinone biosynthesis C-methylase UbiE
MAPSNPATTNPTVVNHHSHHPGFAGVGGLVAGLTMSVGRGRAARLAADLAGVGPSDVVVDIGCGPGRAVREARRRGATAIGIDPAAVMLTLARTWTLRRGRVTWKIGTAEHVPVADESATVVWSLATIHHWHDVGAGLHEVVRILRPGGRFVALERRSHPGATGLASHGWTTEQAAAFVEECAAAGLDDMHTSVHDVGHRVVVVTAVKR